MNAVLMDDVELGKECIVGALSFLKSNSIWASRSLIVGNPAQHVGNVSDELYAHKKEGTALYQSLPKAAKQDLVRCEPLQSEPVNRPEEFPSLETWPQRKKRLRIE